MECCQESRAVLNPCTVNKINMSNKLLNEAGRLMSCKGCKFYTEALWLLEEIQHGWWQLGLLSWQSWAELKAGGTVRWSVLPRGKVKADVGSWWHCSCEGCCKNVWKQPVQLRISCRLKNRVVCWNVNFVISLSAVFSMWVWLSSTNINTMKVKSCL